MGLRGGQAVSWSANVQVDAIFCGSDIIARGVLDGLRERGHTVPDDVAVVGFDNWEIIATQARPPLTTVDMNLHDLGREAAERLLAMMEGARETGNVRLPCRLVVRASCGEVSLPEQETGNRLPSPRSEGRLLAPVGGRAPGGALSTVGEARGEKGWG